MSQQPVIPLDPVSVIAATLVGAVGQSAGHQIAAYIVIMGLSGIGSMVALGRREPDSRMPPWLFVLGLTAATAACAAGAAEVIAHYTGWSVYWLLAPVSLIAAAIGHEWPALVRWALRQGGSLIVDLLRSKTGGQRPPGGP